MRNTSDKLEKALEVPLELIGKLDMAITNIPFCYKSAVWQWSKTKTSINCSSDKYRLAQYILTHFYWEQRAR